MNPWEKTENFDGKVKICNYNNQLISKNAK